MPEFLSSIAGAGVGSAVSGAFGLIGSGLQYLYNKRLAEQQNQYNLDMWKMQADYNSPQAQMQRFSDAGLNPNLIYGQGNNGNMSAAPQMVTPEAPEFSKPMQEIGKAFNIENLRTLIANRKKAEADADNAETNATRNARELRAEKNFGTKYQYDYSTGKYVLRPLDPEGTVSVIDPSAYYFNRILEGNFNRAYLIPYRRNLMNTQRGFIGLQGLNLQPQIFMNSYDRRFYPFSYWLDKAGKGVKTLQTVGSMFY